MATTFNGTTVNEIKIIKNGYMFLDYIESTGTQYIDTGISPTTDLKVEIRLNPNMSYLSEYAIFGSSWSASGYFLMVYQNNIRFHSRNYVFDGTQTYWGEGDNLINTFSHSLTNDCLTINGETIAQSASYGDTADSSTSIHIFDCYNSEKRGHFKLYSMRMWQGSTLIRDFVPALRQSDNVVGLYDLVNNVFYTNQGTGMFYCSEIIPNTYQQVEYLQGTGTQYIDLGFATTTGMICQYKANWQTAGYICGSHSQTSPYGRNGGYLHVLNSDWELGYGETFPQASYSSLANTDYEVEFSTLNSSAYLKVDGNTIITSSGQSTSSDNVLLLACGYYSHAQLISGMSTSAKLYYCKISLSGMSFDYDLVPCYRKSDNVVGVYDIIGGTFYSSVSSDNFIAGPNVIKGRTRLLGQTTPLTFATRTSLSSYTSTQLSGWFPLSSDTWGSISNTSELQSHIGEYIAFKFLVTDTNKYGYAILKLNSISGTTISTENVSWGYGGSDSYLWTLGRRNII